MNRGIVVGLVGAMGSIVSTAFGGWDHGLQTLVFFMAADYLTGMMVAGVFHRSPKTATGALSSNAGLRGLCKKAVMLLLVMVAVRLELILGVGYLRDAAVIALIVNELVSLLENAGLMGAPIPGVLRRAVDLLNQKKGDSV